MNHKLSPLPPNPLVSIIVPSFNQGTYIRETIDSILSQDYRPIEIILVDGASTDNTIDVLHSYDDNPEVRWVSEPDSGVVEAVNKGFRRAQGQIAGIQSSDDFYMGESITEGVEALTKNPGLGFVFGDIVKIDAHGNEVLRKQLGPFSPEKVLSVQTWIPQPSTFFRLDLAKSLGGWRESVPYAADTDLWYRMMLKSEARKVDAVWAKRRVHGAQRDIQGEKIIRDYSQVISDLFERFGAPEELRPAAEAGLLLMKNRYGYGEEPAVKLERMREAVRHYPPLKEHLNLPSAIPGLDRIKGVARGIQKLVSL